METIQKFIALNKENRLRIAVIGDAMVDSYQYGTVDRISPEFSIPILTSHDEQIEQCPGGAANVCLQMKHFNLDVFLISFLDKEASNLFKKHNFNTSYCVDLDKGRIPRKIRFYDNQLFPLHRWDIEPTNYGEQNIEWFRIMAKEKFYSLIKNEKIDAVILSDYNKGFWDLDLAQKIIVHCKENKIISVVDPKKNLKQWCGCDFLKPNSKEAKELASHQQNVKDQTDYIKNELGCHGVIITQSGKGVVGKEKDNYFEHWTPQKLSSKEVNSVIGAGDCFAAVMTIALLHGFTLKESCELAFEGGVQYVKARHNKPITLHDIYARFDAPSAKILTLDELVYLKENIYLEDKFVFTNGCFDLLGTHHLDLLKYAKSLGTKLIVAVNDDDSVKRLKGSLRPIITLSERMKALSVIEYVDYVLSFSEDDPYNLIKRIKPNKMCKGGDYQKLNIVGSDIVGVDNIVLFPYKDGYSTSKLIGKIKSI